MFVYTKCLNNNLNKQIFILFYDKIECKNQHFAPIKNQGHPIHEHSNMIKWSGRLISFLS